MWLAEMVMAPEALQQSGVVVVGVGVGGVVAAGGSRAVVVRAGARAAWSVERGWVGCLQRVREDGEVGQVGRGARLRAGTADARGCGREGRGARGEGRDYFTASLCGRLLVVSKLRVCWAGRLRSLVGKSTKAQ